MPSSPARIDLFQGWPSPSLLPTALLQRASQRVLANESLTTPALLYGPDPGPPALLRSLSAFLAHFYSISWSSPSRLTITGGASQSLACILQVFADPSYTQNVYMIAPTYFLACRIFEDNGFAGRLKAVPEDDQGIDIERLAQLLSHNKATDGRREHRATKTPRAGQKHFKNIIYCVPTFSNPSGKTMSLRRREQLVRLARRHDALIISDDVYDLLHWDPQCRGKAVVPRLVDIDHVLDGGVISALGNVVSNGSFSKVLGPGLRTGWTESTELFAQGLSQCGSTRSGGSPSQFTASIIAEALRSGDVTLHLDHVLIPQYRERCEAAQQAVQTYLVPCGVMLGPHNGTSGKLTTPQASAADQGGFYLYLHLPASVNAASYASLAEEQENVIVGSGDHFEVSGDEHSVPIRHTIRICFAWEDPDLIVEGIRRLGRVLQRMTAQ